MRNITRRKIENEPIDLFNNNRSFQKQDQETTLCEISKKKKKKKKISSQPIRNIDIDTRNNKNQTDNQGKIIQRRERLTLVSL